MVDPRTDRDRLVGHAYKTSAPFLARTGLYRYQRDPIDIRRWVLDRAQWAPGARMLDVGCGPGRYLATVREVEPSSGALGMDLSAGMAAEAFSFAPTLVGDAQAIPFRADAFDIVLAAHMLYHVPDIDAALREIARVLRPDGTLLVVLNGRVALARDAHARSTGARRRRARSPRRGACRSGARNAFRSRRPNRS